MQKMVKSSILLAASMLAALLIVSIAVPTPAFAHEPADIPPAPEPRPGGGGGGGGGEPFAVVSQFPTPNVSVVAGGVVVNTVIIQNIGTSSSDNVEVTIPIDPTVLAVIDIEVSIEQIQVISVTETEIVLNTDEIDEDEFVFVNVYFNVLEGIPNGTPLFSRIEFDGDGVDDDRNLSNLPVVVVGDVDINLDFYNFFADPVSGPSGATHTFAAAVFMPTEPVTLWYNTPDNIDIEVGTVLADVDGIVAVAFTTGGLPPGTYAMVGNGNWSGVRVTGNFIVTGDTDDDDDGDD